MQYIVVQAGGRGSRLGRLTRNKPKALVPVDNLPMLFHLFRAYPDSKFIIIGDYKRDVLERYLSSFADVDYEVVDGSGAKGTCAGLSSALEFVPGGAPFLLIWCDLVLPEGQALPDGSVNAIGISKDFECRWSYEDGAFAERPSAEHGVAGYFAFRDKSLLDGVPAEGEFVRWLSESCVAFEGEVPLRGAREFGLIEEWERLPISKCRPFNRIAFDGNRVTKVPIDEQGRSLAKREVAWYEHVKDEGFANVPTIYATDPLCMEHVEGGNLYEYGDLSRGERRRILEQVISCLRQVHALGSAPFDAESYYDAYIGKTAKRLEKVRGLVPFADDKAIVVNGRKCRSVFYHWDELAAAVSSYAPSEFAFLHGDCTFSNMMLRTDGTPVLIDPRGYFGRTELYGDPAYDWVKLYYSLYSNYDQFNLKRFDLWIEQHGAHVDVLSNKWEDLEGDFFELLEGEVTRKQMKLLLAITWLSLTTYAWEDYDSICGAFYLGTYYLEEAL